MFTCVVVVRAKTSAAECKCLNYANRTRACSSENSPPPEIICALADGFDLP